ncbi:hypothetical protein DVR14_21130 (plasmid) [Natrinema thermotolerans]|nr:hypothetical protein DVR14_21130 [Natrinema thermotolerans]
MGILGYIVTTVLAFINGITTGALEFLQLYRVAFLIDKTLTGWANGFVAWEDGINRRFDLIAGEVNQTLDQGSDGLFSAFQTGLETIQGGFAWVAGVGNTWANWPSYVNSHIVPDVPRLATPEGAANATLPFTDLQPLAWFTNLIDAFNAVLSGLESIVTFIFYIPGIIFVPVGIILNSIFSRLLRSSVSPRDSSGILAHSLASRARSSSSVSYS